MELLGQKWIYRPNKTPCMGMALGETVGVYNVGPERPLSKAEGALDVVAVLQPDGSRGAVHCTLRNYTETF